MTGAAPTMANKRPPTAQRPLEARVVNRHRTGHRDDVVFTQGRASEGIARLQLHPRSRNGAQVRRRDAP